MYVVQSGIPLPPPRRGHRSYPFPTMAVGESFVCDAADKNRIASAASQYGKRHGVRFAVRKDGDSLRCWRVA